MILIANDVPELFLRLPKPQSCLTTTLTSERLMARRFAPVICQGRLAGGMAPGSVRETLNRTGNELQWRRFMDRRKKRPIGKGPTKEPAKKLRFSWLWVTVTIAGLALFATSSILLRKKRVETVHSGPGPNSSIAPGEASTGAPAGSKNALAANDGVPKDVDRAADLLNRGTQLLAQGKVDEAVAQYQEAVKLNPEDEDGHYSLAFALARQGNRKAAEEQYLEALRVFPDYLEAHDNLGNLLVADGKFEEAIAHFKAALKISTESASVHNNLGNALARQGHVTEAIPCFREAVRLNPDYIEARYNLGTAYLSQGQTDEAVSEFTNITQRHPEFGPAQRGLLKARELQTK